MSAIDSLKNRIRCAVLDRYGVAPRDWLAKDLPTIQNLKGIYRNASCFLMANGPSLNKVDFSQLAGKHIIGLNKVHLLLERYPIELTAHVAVNQHVIEQCAEQFAQLKTVSFLSYYGSRGVRLGGNSVRLLSNGALSFSSIDESLWEGHTVTYVALQVAFYLGFSQVFIVGMDHKFQSHGAPNELQILSGDDPNHFDPRYFSNQNWQLPDLEASELAYRMADFVFRRAGRRVYDASEGGHCQIFEKISFDEAVYRYNSFKKKF